MNERSKRAVSFAWTVLRLLTPLLIPLLGGLLYSHLNVARRLFVGRLGCGCTDGFNTNSLTLLVGYALIASAAVVCWRYSRGLPRSWRTAYLAACGVGFLVLLLQFLAYNAWA
jgi:hypothetical protein